MVLQQHDGPGDDRAGEPPRPHRPQHAQEGVELRLSLDHVVACGAADYFDVIGDPRRRREWNASVRSVEVLTDGPPVEGTRWIERTWGLGTFAIEIVEHDPPRRFAERTVEPSAGLWLELELTPVGETSTLVHLEAGGGVAGWRSPLQRLLNPLMPALIRADLDRAARRSPRRTVGA